MEYLIGKMTAVFTVSFAAVALPLFLNLFLTAGLYPDCPPDKLSFLAAGILDVNMFLELFHGRPSLYALVFILIDGIIGGLMGLVSLSVSRWCSTHFAVVMFPFVLYILTGVLFQNAEGEHLSLMVMADPMQDYVTAFAKVVLTCLVIFVVSMGITWLCARKRDIV